MADTALPESLTRFEATLATVSRHLAGQRGDALDEALRDALRELCAVLGTDRSAFLEFSEDGTRLEALYAFAAEGIPLAQGMEINRLRWIMRRLQAGQSLVFERLPDELPPGAAAERDYVANTGMKSNLSVPIEIVGHPVGALATAAFRSHRSWPPVIVERVRLFGELLTAAIHRRRQERALEESHVQIERLNRRLQRENAYLRDEIRTDRYFDEIVGSSPAMRRALAAVEQVAPLDTSVLLLGETGTGKELFARAIHDRSPRSERPLVKLNCAALPAGLVESELFGHEKGAFTGAGAARPGRFEVADGGTLLLDEIGDLSADAQAKLLRVLQEGEFERLGSTRTRSVDVRVIAATHRDLHQLSKNGDFRPDLYYRLSVFPIEIPPLRERREDIEPLVWFLIHRRQKALGRRIETIPPETMEALRAYDWPGNVRELDNVVERAMILSPGPVLVLDSALSRGAREAAGTPAPPAPREGSLDSVQRAHILSVLESCGWRINGPDNAAERLELHPNTLRSRMKKLGITRPERRPDRGRSTPLR